MILKNSINNLIQFISNNVNRLMYTDMSIKKSLNGQLCELNSEYNPQRIL